MTDSVTNRDLIRSRISREVDKLLGKKYKWLGRGPDEFDCFGLFCYLVYEIAGECVPDFLIDYNNVNLRDLRAEFNLVQVPLEPLDIIYYTHGENDTKVHVSIYENERWVVTASPELGVCRLRYDDEMKRASAMYRYKKL